LVFRLLKRLPTHPITKKEKKHFSLRGTFLFGDAISGVNFPTARRDTMTRHELPVPRLPHEGTDSLGKVQTSHWLGPKHGAPEWKKKDDLKRKYFRFLSFSVLSRKRSCMTIEDGGVTGKLRGTWALPPACCPVCHWCGISYPALCAAVVCTSSHAVGFMFQCMPASAPGGNQPGRACRNCQKGEVRATGLPESHIPCLFHPVMAITGTRLGTTPTVELDMTKMNKKPL
jgi:hypothetical protein